MANHEGMISFSSLLKLDNFSQKDKTSVLIFLVAIQSLHHVQNLYNRNILPPTMESDLLDEVYDSSEDPTIFSKPHANPEVNLKNVFTGLVAILTGQSRARNSDPPQRSCSSDISFLRSEKDGDTFIHPSVCLPSAPPLLEAEALNYSTYREVLLAEPPEWLPDSYSTVCMQCNSSFTALTRGRHHCRFCGGFSAKIARGEDFRVRDPQRVCDACYDRLDPLQGILISYISNATQSAKHDVTDWTCTRGWLNLPIGLSMEYEIYKSANTLRSYCQVGRLNPENSIPSAVLKGANGLAILTVAKAGALVTYKVGTGLVVSRRSDGSWSAPSAILSVGLGWGLQFGGELVDFIIVLHGQKAVKAFSSTMHVSLGAGVNIAAGPVGRALEADLRAGNKGSGMCYTYSCSKGAFVGVSLEGNVVATRTETNLSFYGDPYLTTHDILFGQVERPRAAAPLYTALHELYSKMGC
ncbi:SH3 domain-containing protein [Ananas comosus]|uniref:SH3 domain-containing protein n=1 Tax=Ananas comosus TaxID=4615 RepID=A0A199VI31_ANACO|nr:SH3 domain-containing protein [Ananas comosus]